MPRIKEEYAVTDREGNQIGPKQVFEADTPEEMIAKLKAAHQNAAGKLYETKLQVKLGNLMEPDPDQPILTYEEKPLTADELVRVQNLQKDPRTATEAYKIMIESQFGAPIANIRKTLQDTEIMNRARFMDEQITLFRMAHPEYVGCDANKKRLLAYLNKKEWALTKNNLELAYEDLTSKGDELLIQAHAPEPEIPHVEPVVQPAIPAATATAAPAPPVTAEIPPAPTPAAPISAPPTEAAVAVSVAVVPPKSSSSGLGRAAGSVQAPPVAPKAKEITRAEIAAMTSQELGERIRKDPAFAKKLDEMYR